MLDPTQLVNSKPVEDLKPSTRTSSCKNCGDKSICPYFVRIREIELNTGGTITLDGCKIKPKKSVKYPINIPPVHRIEQTLPARTASSDLYTEIEKKFRKPFSL